jgi:hypothetical protein
MGAPWRAGGGGWWRSPVMWETMFGHGGTKLDALGSTSGLSWCCRSIGSGLRSGSGGCRRRAVAAVEVRRGTTLGKRECRGREARE